MEVRSSRRVRTLVTQMARSGLSANEIAPALIPMMARSETLQSKAGYIDARPLPLYRRNSLATHGRTIHCDARRLCAWKRTSRRSPLLDDRVKPGHDEMCQDTNEKAGRSRPFPI